MKIVVRFIGLGVAIFILPVEVHPNRLGRSLDHPFRDQHRGKYPG